ncbi:UDP-N-acetylmuramoyl-L-alanyl-D-glutamate--2,6-diaminopimelate ligase [Venenivibrio stagnispumantis]|uniref:UDP-N-acetylmuramoyl-L-alanyl-D-glutamate--2,6-diaminopimelate ligase n=2 Tax=Venenivibrio stagnispumantis TaxID=407998 RepID=A0AA46AD63_9AQUI|nr:UDP-N-acetylmuramoylalanyl-D-glutamate--2,6-diaminopimelate ligase [Venenivibrio stagnispumantis]
MLSNDIIIYMKIEKILNYVELFYKGNDKEILHITQNSKDIKENTLFIAIKGTKFDGHSFVLDAIKNGVIGVVLEDRQLADKLKKEFNDINIFLSDNTKKALSFIASEFFENPSKDLKIIGITGTNGKTTTSNLLATYYELLGEKVGIIGTINHRVGNEILSEGMTTPDHIKWQQLLKTMKDKGASVVVAEISSHALDQDRVYATKFHGAIFTNLTQDHLDYHKDMENYFLAKRKLFEMLDNNRTASINTDDFYGKRIYQEFKDRLNIISYGKENADFKIGDIKQDLEGTEFEFIYNGEKSIVKTKLIGEFNVYNLSAVISFLIKEGVDKDFLIKNAVKLNPVKGRFEIVKGKGFIAVIDYAHTPDGLENLLKTVRKLKNINRVITIFGAGGDRDKTKRAPMGEIAERYSDIIILTSDNPRSENPLDIIEDIKKGIKSKNIIIQPDREKAIKTGIEMAKEGDIVVIAGKGHENYQIIGDNIIYFDDKEIAEKYIRSRDDNR